jgi:Mlc titration factor MtfA (ptsG expression regulator)
LWTSAVGQLGFLSYLTPAQLSRLKHISEQLLHRKPIVGAQGLNVTDEMAVLVAAQAALPVLELSLDLYEDMSAIVLYPGAFSVRQQQVDDAGVVHEWQETLAGEAVGQGGAVVLSWDDLAFQQQSGAPHNIVIHEFAHKIDMGRGDANGFPPFLAGLHERDALSGWTAAFSDAYADFCTRVEAFENCLSADFDDEDPVHAAQYDELAASLPLDPYAARDPAEFFAVASEAFFVAPAPLAAAYARVYALLTAYYRQNPLKAG